MFVATIEHPPGTPRSRAFEWQTQPLRPEARAARESLLDPPVRSRLLCVAREPEAREDLAPLW